MGLDVDRQNGNSGSVWIRDKDKKGSNLPTENIRATAIWPPIYIAVSGKRFLTFIA
jgi:hypothetical protein